MKPIHLAIAVFSLFGAMVFFAFFANRDHFTTLCSIYLIAFGAYYFIARRSSTMAVPAVIGLVILLRLPFLFAAPVLSDDVYRFLWDGQLMVEGVNPYLSLPSEIDAETAMRIDPEELLRNRMNSINYHSVYPPLNQMLFWAVAIVSDHSLTQGLIAYRLLLILGDVLAVLLMAKVLVRMGRLPGDALWYALNPLLIIEGAGNIHFEGLVFALLMAALFFYKRRVLGAVFYYLSVLLKLIPLIFIPLVLKSKKWRDYLLAALAPLALLLGLWLFQGDGGFWSSLGLYFGSFEFNAGLYYFFRAIGSKIVGYNPIGVLAPLLALAFTLFAVIYAYLQRKKTGPTALLKQASVMLLVYLLLTTTVHPWYLITLLGLTVMAGYRFAIWWSLLVFLSYSHYDGGGFQENYILIALEYLLLGLGLLFEFHPWLRNRLCSTI